MFDMTTNGPSVKQAAAFDHALECDDPVACVVCEIPVDSVDDVAYGDLCAGNRDGQLETLTPLLVRHSHDDAPDSRVTGRIASTERLGLRQAALSRFSFLGIGPRLMVAALVAVAMVMAVVPTAHADDHTVAAGDTLWTIAAAYGVSVDELIELNSIDDPRTLRIGQSLQLPEAPYDGATLQHIVQPGETLISIAALYEVSPDAVLRLNDLTNANHIQVASVLDIPDPATVVDTGIDEDGYMIVDVEYTVESGDTLTGIAQAHNVEPGAIVRASGLQSANIIQVGQVLLVPERVLVSQKDRLAVYFETWAEANSLDPNTVSYTHLTLPTKA